MPVLRPFACRSVFPGFSYQITRSRTFFLVRDLANPTTPRRKHHEMMGENSYRKLSEAEMCSPITRLPYKEPELVR